MSLIDDLKKWYESNSYPPGGGDLDSGVDDQKTEQVSYEVVDSAARWGNHIEVVYRRGDEYATVYDIEPATEMQDWGDYGTPEIFAVEPVEVTKIKYVKVD